ncbi:MAG: cytochrome P450 [Pseudomonadota bacterium]
MTTLAADHRIPHDNGSWPFQYFVGFYRDIGATTRELYRRNGPVVRSGWGKLSSVALFGPEANQLVLQNRDEIFSSRLGWGWVIDHVFPGAIMTMDGEEHRFQRRIMNHAFKKPALVTYLGHMNGHIADGLRAWQSGSDFRVFPAVKQLTLDLASRVFMGIEPGVEATRLNQAFIDTVEGSIAAVRFDLPGTLYRRGLRGREHLVRTFHGLLPGKRARETPDFFSAFCHAVSESGERYTDDEIVDHMAFLMMAAHDTTTSTLTTMFYALGQEPAWQERLREESRALARDGLEFDDLEKLAALGWTMKEALRRYPPLPVMPRYATREFEFMGYRIPAHTQIGLAPIHTHHMEEIWSQPFRFDPERFAPGRDEHKRHPYAWVPFGGGAHMCIGQHFADLQVKAILHQVLLRYRWSVPRHYRMPYQLVPIAKPRDGLPVTLTRL